jgi:hypothetical protein
MRLLAFRFFIASITVLGVVSCNETTGPSLLVEPITIASVDVVIRQTELLGRRDPAEVSAHVQGYLGDGCSSLQSQTQSRAGATITLRILRARPAQAVCTQIAKLYDEVIRLEGEFPTGTYLLRVNDVEKTFVIP